jgi:hypothetical protein
MYSEVSHELQVLVCLPSVVQVGNVVVLQAENEWTCSSSSPHAVKHTQLTSANNKIAIMDKKPLIRIVLPPIFFHGIIQL